MIGGVTIGEIINKDWRIDPPKRVTSPISDPPATSMKTGSKFHYHFIYLQNVIEIVSKVLQQRRTQSTYFATAWNYINKNYLHVKC